MAITIADKLKCIDRELKMRRRVYGRWIAEGRMKQKDSDHEIDTMEAIHADYVVLAAEEAAKNRLI